MEESDRNVLARGRALYGLIADSLEQLAAEIERFKYVNSPEQHQRWVERIQRMVRALREQG